MFIVYLLHNKKYLSYQSLWHCFSKVFQLHLRCISQPENRSAEIWLWSVSVATVAVPAITAVTFSFTFVSRWTLLLYRQTGAIFKWPAIQCSNGLDKGMRAGWISWALKHHHEIIWYSKSVFTCDINDIIAITLAFRNNIYYVCVLSTTTSISTNLTNKNAGAFSAASAFI